MTTLLIIGGIVVAAFFFGSFMMKSAWRVVHHALRPKLLVALIAVVGGIWWFSGSGEGGDRSTATNADRIPPPVRIGENGKRIPPNDPVTYPAKLPAIPSKTLNGNSRFAKNLVLQMSRDERRYYSREFYHAIESTSEGSTHQWLYQDVKGRMFGRLTPGERYTSPGGGECRNFQELLVWHHSSQRLTGSACRQESGGWCKLRRGSTLSCNLSSPSGFGSLTASLMQTLRRWF